MFDFVRSHNRVLQVVLGIVIIPTFGFVGLQSYLQSNEAAVPVASVDGRDISHADWDAERRQDIEQIRARNPQIDLKLLDTPEAQRRSLDSIVRDRVLQAAVAHENLSVSDERIVHEYQTNPEFEQLRAMPKATRDAVLAQQGLNGNILFDRIGRSLAQSQAQQGVALSGFAPASALKASTDAWFDQRDIQWQRFDTKDYAAAVQPTDAQVEAYYKAHAADFVAPEQAKIEYLVLDAAALQSQVKADPTLVQGYYEANKSRFTTPEERSASYILAKVAPNASPAEVAKASALALATSAGEALGATLARM